MLGPKAEFILTQETYSEKDHSSITELSRAMQNDGSWLSQVATHVAYSNKEFGRQNFPMLFLTEGMGDVEKVDNFDYKFALMGKIKRTSKVAKSVYSDSDKVGLGRAKFQIPFADKHFAAQQTIVARGNVSLRVQGEPQQRDGMWWYTFQVWGNDSAFVPAALLKAGTIWGAGVFKVPFEDSYGVESRSQLPATGTNMTSLVRHTFKVKGNVQNKIMKYKINVGTKSIELYTEWERFLADLEFKEQCELDLWKSKYGRDPKTGEFLMYDEETALGIPSGAGIDDQIPNVGSHSFLTYKKLSAMVRDVTFNIKGANPNVEIWTGTGGMEDINNALKTDMQGFTMVDSKQFVSGGNGYDMIYGSYFKAFRHQDGALVTFRHHPMFDTGILGDISDKHPISGLPKSSHDIYILDRSVYDGVPNFKYVMEKGREYTTWEVSGAVTLANAKQINRQGAHDRDRAEIHGMKSQGIQIGKPHTCYKSECI